MKIKTLHNNKNFVFLKIVSKYTSILYLVSLLGVFSACEKNTSSVNEKDLFDAFAQDPKYGGDYAKTLPYDNPDSCMKRIRAEVPAKWRGYMCMNLFYHLPSSISDSLNLKFLDSFESAFPHDSVREFSQLLRGKIFIDAFQFDTARKCLEDCYASSMRGQRMTRAGDAKKYLGRMAVLRGHYPEGIQLMLEAYNTYPLSKSYDASQIHDIMLAIARAYKLSHDYQQYQSWSLKACQYAVSMEISARINATVELAEAYLMNRYLDSAQMTVNKVLSMMKESNDYYYCPESYYILAHLQIAEGNCSTALDYFWKAKQTNRTVAKPRFASLYDKGVGDGYACVGKWDSAIFFYKKALVTPDTTAQISIYKQLAVAYKNKGAYKQALEAEMTSSNLNNLVFTATKENTIGYYIAKSEANQAMVVKQKEIDDQKLYMLLTTILVAFLFLLVGFAVYYYRREQKRKDELTSLNATKDKLFALLSHDLMSPVSVLKNHIILMDWGAMSQEKFAESLQRLKTSIHYTSNMLENVLHWAVSQMGGMKPKTESIHIAESVNEQLILIQSIADDKGIHLHQAIPNEAVLKIDKNHFGLIVRNLLQNALKFTPTGGTINLSFQNTEGVKTLTIQDSGMGMSPEILSQLFQINKNTHREGTSKEKGTGLGLILTKELVELNKGQISVASEVGKGTTFSLVFDK
ncbi:MAG: HAMP domain-containing histidine kinase [Saprospiraceae bacterium]|nr:HAMP domain-containing histidine kinase [Saprospiraceae bacterium]